MHVDRVAQLQRALSSLQIASNRREQTERDLRIQLENELKMERARNNKTSQSQNNIGNFFIFFYFLNNFHYMSN